MAEPAYQALLAHGAHLTLIHATTKKPIKKGWQKNSATAEEIEGHLQGGGQLGVIPGSLNLIVVDVDAGTHGIAPDEVKELLGPPLLSAPTRTPGNAHLYYRRPESFNGKLYQWSGGEVLADTRNAILYGDAVAQLVDVLPQLSDAPTPDLTVLPRPTKSTRAAVAVREAPEGSRNNTLSQQAFQLAVRGQDPRTLREAAMASGLSVDEVDSTIQSAIAKVKSMHPPWYVVGEHYAKAHWEGTARYVIGNGAPRWWVYKDARWRMLTEKDYEIQHAMDRRRYAIAQELVEAGQLKAADVLGDTREWRTQQTSFPGEFWAGMSHHLAGDEPKPKPKHFAAENGVIDLLSGDLLTHSPEHGTRSVAAGRYRPEDAEHLREVLETRLDRILTSVGQEDF